MKIKVKFNENFASLKNGFEKIRENLEMEESDKGLPISITKGSGLKISLYDGHGSIEYSERAEFFRALAILADKIKSGEESFELYESKKFDSCGVMIDCSRNAVLKTETLETIFRNMALMGLNTAMLYTEDTYEIDGYPYFGYMRGAYTKEELRALDEYCAELGIELVPCIQTLAHLKSTLRWNYGKALRDNDSVLLAGEENVYKFIDAMFKTAEECFSSKKIHIGMDEAHGVGLGNYLLKNGYKNRFDILTGHLNRIVDIAHSHGKEPMMWSDMFFRLGSKTNTYYDTETEIPSDIETKIPKDISLVYWDYYHDDYETYDKMISLHKNLHRPIIFAGGIWKWSGLGAAYHKTFSTTASALKACRKHGIKQVVATMWSDDGAEVSAMTSLLGMQLFAEYSYYDDVDFDTLSKRFKTCTGYDAQTFMLFDCDDFPHEQRMADTVAVSKNVLYQDILCGLFDENFSHIEVKAHFEALLEKISQVKNTGDITYLVDLYKRLYALLVKKSDFGIKITAAYKTDDRVRLKEYAAQLTELKQETDMLRKCYREVWYHENKPFGYDMIDIRMGGLVARIDTAYQRLCDYTDGKCVSIEELEVTKLPYGEGEEKWIPNMSTYDGIFSASTQFHI